MSKEDAVKNEDDPRVIYSDIIDLPHHEPVTRPRMSLQNRAAQFSAFDALAGFSDMISEEARITDFREEAGEEERKRVNRQLNRLAEALDDRRKPEAEVTCFVPDERKTGGRYETVSGMVKRVDPVRRELVFLAETGRADGRKIAFDNIVNIVIDTIIL